jgi:succinate dehydrogenase/fumarate reductase flavoprotein subunit
MPIKRVEGLRLEDDEYEALTIYSRLDIGPNGLTFREKLDEVMGLTAYLLATPDTQSEMIRSIQTAYDDYARARLEMENPSFADRLQRHRERRQRLRAGF